MSSTHTSACFAVIVTLLSGFSNAAIGEEKLEREHYNKAGELVSRPVCDPVFNYRKTYLSTFQVAKKIKDKRDGEIRIDHWRIKQETFREFYDEFKKHEAILVELRVDRATNDDIQKISDLSNLKQLVLDDCQADDLSPLTKLKKLESLSIHHPNMTQLRDEKLLQRMESLRILRLISVPSLQEAIDLPLPPLATLSDEGYSDGGLRSIRIYAPTWDGKAITIPERLKHLVLSFACGQKGYVCLSQAGIEIRARPEFSEEVSDSLRKLVYHSGLMENPAIADKTRLRIDGPGYRDVVIDLSPLKAFSRLEHLTIDTGGKYTGFANLNDLPLRSVYFGSPEPYGPSEENVKNLELHPTLAKLEHNFYSASCVLPINRLRIIAMRAETEEGESLPSNMVAVELNQPNEINFETGERPKESRWDRQDYACWLGAQGNRTKASEITGEYDPKKTKDPDVGLFIWSDSDKHELTGRREYRHHGTPLKGGKQKYSESVWHIDPVSKNDKGSPIYTRTVYVEALSPGDYEVRWMVRDRSTDTFLEPKSDKITIRVEEKDGKLHARALPKSTAVRTKTGRGPTGESETDSTSNDGSAKNVAAYTPPPVPRSRSGQLLPYIPGPGDSIPYDEIVWPWMMGGSGTGDWHGIRRYRVGPEITIWRNSVDLKIWNFKSEDGSVLEDFRPGDQKVHAIEIRIQPREEPEAIEILEQLQYFPEVREVYIRTILPLENHLASLRYCPYIRRLKIDFLLGGNDATGKRIEIGEESVKAIGTLTQLREMSFINIAINDKDLEHFKEMPDLLYLDLTNTSVTSKSFHTIATFPRIRYLKVYGNNYDQELDEATRKALESLVGRVEYLWDNRSDTVAPCTKIHSSMKPLFDEIKKNGYRARKNVDCRKE